MNRIVLFALVLIISSSCNRKIQQGNGLEEIPFKINCDKLTHLIGDGIDSQIGTIICDDISLSYDYGFYSNSEPESMTESFSKSFYAYYSSKFFDAIFFDNRMREIFKDSVQIMKVDNQIVDEKYIINCKDCNATAYLKFNDITFLYPFIVNDKVVMNQRKFDIDRIIISDYYKKIYISKEGKSSGVFIAPLGKPIKNRKKNKLSVFTTHLPTSRLKKIFESIDFK